MEIENKTGSNLGQILRYNIDDVDIHEIKTLYHGFFKMDEYHVSHQLFKGGKSEVLSREIFERGNAVVLIPYDPVSDSVVLLEQFRPGALREGDSPWLLEFVAGMFDEDEKPQEVAIREAKEEADLTINENEIIEVMNYFSSPGGMSEYIHLLAAKVDQQYIETHLAHSVNNIDKTYGLPEEGEDILVHIVKRESALALLAEGKITNAATIIGLQWLALHYQQLQTDWITNN